MRERQEVYLAAYKALKLAPYIGSLIGFSLADGWVIKKALAALGGYMAGFVVKYYSQKAVFDYATKSRVLIRLGGEVFKLKPENGFSKDPQVDLKKWSAKYGQLVHR